MKYLLLVAFLAVFQDDPPFKPKEEFEIKFDLSFKQRIHEGDSKTVHLDETRAERERRTSTTPLPYLKLLVKILTVQPEEIKLKVVRDNRNHVITKKVEEGLEFKLEVGFTDDVKDKISGYKYVMEFLSSDKKAVSRILIEFDEDGNYFLNGEKRGKI